MWIRGSIFMLIVTITQYNNTIWYSNILPYNCGFLAHYAHCSKELWLGLFTELSQSLFSRPRRQTKYGGCSENHGIRPPAPEQYLTPLQQKEVCIRHLRARLKENVERLQDRSVAEKTRFLICCVRSAFIPQISQFSQLHNTQFF